MNKNIKSVAALAIAVTISVLINSFIAAPKKANADPFIMTPGTCTSGSPNEIDGDAYSSATNTTGTNFAVVNTQTLSYMAFFDVNNPPFGNTPSSFNTLNCQSRQAMTAVKLRIYVNTSGPNPDGVSYNIRCCNLIGS